VVPLASIPSPSGGTIEIGPLTLRAYGLMLLLGIIAAVWTTHARWVARGGDRELVLRMSMWVVAGGIVGARIYHVASSWDEVPDEWWGVFAVWKGGLSIFGGVLGGLLAGGWVVRRAGVSVAAMMDAVAPGLLLAQAIGRWGNYFNQELFGKPSGLPWALEIDPENRPAEYAADPTFHPIFLYESIWNFIGVGLLLWIDRRFRLRPPALFCLYAIWYSLARVTFEESLRVDPSHYVAGLRLNHWISIGVLLVAGWFLARALRGGPGSDRGAVAVAGGAPARVAPAASRRPRPASRKGRSGRRRR
jgi:prolipoprotein diacylglyceryl transferase